VKKAFRIAAALMIAVLSGCATAPPSDVTDACAIFSEKRSWWKAADRAERKYGAPKAVTLAIIRQESGFDDDARPPRRRILFVIPGFRRQSTAYGYAQATDPTWTLYKRDTGRAGARRGKFSDAVDFVGWYVRETRRRTGVEAGDAYNQYLAYHEGWAGYLNQTYAGRKKSGLRSVAARVSANAAAYQVQLDACERRFRRGVPLIPGI